MCSVVDEVSGTNRSCSMGRGFLGAVYLRSAEMRRDRMRCAYIHGQVVRGVKA